MDNEDINSIWLTMHNRFEKIARDKLDAMNSTFSEMNDLASYFRDVIKEDPNDFSLIIAREEEFAGFMRSHLRFEDSSYITIVFSAMSVEAYIFTYGARYLGSGFFGKHLDKLGTIDKWILVPQLITGKQFPRDRHAFSLLKQLVKERNDLVHFKSRRIQVHDLLKEAITLQSTINPTALSFPIAEKRVMPPKSSRH